jgi:hypothetical protein
MRIFIPIALFVIFLGWAAYRFFIKKDLKLHYNEFGLGLLFTGVWSVIYFIIAKI